MVIQIHIKVIYTNAKLKKTRDKAINIKAINIKATNIKSRKINYIQNHIIHDMCSRWKAHVNHDMSFTTLPPRKWDFSRWECEKFHRRLNMLHCHTVILFWP